MDIALIIIWIVIFVVWYFYSKIKRLYDEGDQLGIPYIGYFESYKNLFDLIRLKISFTDLLMETYQRFEGQDVVGGFDLSRRSFMVRDPKIIKQITIKDFDVFVNHDRNFNEEIDKLMGKMLVVMVDDQWRNMRNILSPIFTSSKMKMMFGILSDCANNFITHYDEKAKKTGSVEIDCKETFSRYTIDGICSAVLGFQGDCVVNEDSELYKFTTNFQTPTFKENFKTILFTLARKIYVLLKLQLTRKEVYDFFYNAIVKVMNERDEKGIFRPDVIQLLLQAKKGQLQVIDKENEVNDEELSNFSANVEYDVKAKNKKLANWTDEHYMAQGFIFFAAGFDTTQLLLQVTAFALVTNKDVQQKLINEVDEVIQNIGEAPVTYEALHKMKYLDMVISEALRYWPPAILTTRECEGDYILKLNYGKSVKLIKGDILNIPIYAIHHDERYFSNPDQFDPERFNDDRKDSIIDGTYIPFGYGPRVCIGSRFALMEAKLLIFNILRKFTIEACSKTPKKLELAKKIGQFVFKDPIIVELKPRN